MNIPQSHELRAKLLKRLAEENVDLAALQRLLGDSAEAGKLARLLNSHAFSQPYELTRLGYPEQEVVDAIRSANAIIDESVREICALVAASPPIEVEPPRQAEPLPEMPGYEDAADTVKTAPPEETAGTTPEATGHLQPIPDDPDVQFIL